MRRKRPPLPSEPPREIIEFAERRLRESGMHDDAPHFREWVMCMARVYWRHELGLDQ